MQDYSELDKLVEVNPAVPKEPLVGLEKTMEEFFVLTGQVKEMSERIKDLRDIISVEADEEAGEYEVTAGEYIAKIKRPVKYTWDEEMLEAIVGGITIAKAPLPDAITTKLKIDKDKYDALPSHEKAVFSPALTTGPGPSKVTVYKKGDKSYED